MRRCMNTSKPCSTRPPIPKFVSPSKRKFSASRAIRTRRSRICGTLSWNDLPSFKAKQARRGEYPMKFIVILSIGLSASPWFVAGFAEPLLGGAAYAQSLPPTTQESRQLANINQHSEQPLWPQQKEVWNGEQNYFQYLQSKDLKSFMSLWEDNFLGWPDYSDHPLRKPDIESSVADRKS